MALNPSQLTQARSSIPGSSAIPDDLMEAHVLQYALSDKGQIDKAVADAIRDEVYPHVDQLIGKPVGYTRDLKQRIGSLMNVSSDLKEHAKTTEKQSMKSAGGAGKRGC